MDSSISRSRFVLAALVCTMLGHFAASTLRADGAHGAHGGASRTTDSHSEHNHASSKPPMKLGLDAGDLQPMYGGQVSATKWHYFEVIYLPQETRVYVYSPSRSPLEGIGLRGEAVMQINGNSTPFRYPLKERMDSRHRVYGSIEVDVTRVRDGDMQVTFELERLPFKEEKKATFTQTFYLTRPPVKVTVAPLAPADGALIMQQETCPVMETGLREQGNPVKLLVGDEPLFVCCVSCIDEVKKHPQETLKKAAALIAANRPPAVAPAVAPAEVFWAVETDDAAMRNQSVCPVTDQPLGAHGRPLKVVVDGRPVFVCCEGCIDEVQINPQRYLKIAGTTGPSRGKPQQEELYQAVSTHTNSSPATVDDREPQALPSPGRLVTGARHIAVSSATRFDQVSIAAQAVCPVTKQPLGAHGTPVKIEMDGQTVFVCCQGCVDQVKRNAEMYLSRFSSASHPSGYTSENDWFYQKPPAPPGGGGL